MGFDKRSTATQYQPQDGDTLEKIAEREAAAGNPVTAAEIARFNWGSGDPEVVDEHLRDELGCYQRGEDKRFVISADVAPRSDLLIPVAFVKTGLTTDTPITLRVKKQAAPVKQFEGCAKVPGITFEFDKSFVRPSVVDNLAELEDALAGHPDAKVMIFGHTDKVGSEAYNKGLSDRRARSVYAFITNQPAIWEELYNDETWGIRAVQEILKDMGGPYDPGPVDGINGSKTKAAVKQFQGDNGLTVDGVAGPNTRAKLFAAYMAGKHDIEIDDSRFMDPKHMGCGEMNPMVETENPCEENRRVTFFLFNEQRLPNLPCKAGDLAPCQRQSAAPLPRHKTEFRCSFYDSIAKNCPKEGGGVAPVVVGALALVAASGTDEHCAQDTADETVRYKVDHHFAPKHETLDVEYNIHGLAARTVTLQVRSERTGEEVYHYELSAAEKADGDNKKLSWNGMTTITSGDLKDRFINPLYGPYTLKLVGDDGSQSKEARVHCLYHSLDLGWGKHTPDGNAPDKAADQDRWAQFRLDELGYDGGPVDGTIGATTHKALHRFQRAHYVHGTQNLLAENGNLDDDTTTALDNATARERWESGKDPLTTDARFYVYDNYFNDRGANLVTTNTPEFNSMDRKAHAEDKMERAFLPLEAEVKLLTKADAGVFVPEAVGPVTVAWEVDDATEDASVIPAATNATARTYVERARQFGNQANVTTATRRDAHGDNCPTSLDGFRAASAADNIKQWLPDDAGSRLVPYQVRGYGKETRDGTEFHRALVNAWDDLADDPRCRGRAGIYFRMSTKGGDDAKIRAALSFDDLPNKDALAKLHEPRKAQLAKETGRWTVYRRSRLCAYCQQAPPTRVSGSPNWATINGWWSEAFYEFENHGAPLQNLTYTTVVPEATYKTAILAMPASHRPAGVTNAASLTYRPSSMYGGPTITQAPGETAIAFVNRAMNAMRAWVTNPINAILGVIHDHVRRTSPEGLIIFDFRIHDPVTGQDWDAASHSFQPTTNPAAKNRIASTAGYVRAAGAVTMNVDNPFNVHCYVLHECGHARFLYHHKTGGGGAGNASDNANHHDADQERCAMSYAIGGDAPNAWFYPFCGKCILRLRGWKITSLPNRYTT